MTHGSQDADFLKGTKYDVILADYLLGALVRSKKGDAHKTRHLCLENVDNTMSQRDIGILRSRLCKIFFFFVDSFFVQPLIFFLSSFQDGFAPYFQHKLLPRLKEHLNPDGWLFFVGTEPIPEKGDSREQQLIADVARTRDAAILLGSDRKRVYREYPLDWVLEHLAIAGFEVLGVGSFDITYSSKTVLRQLAVAERKLQFMDPKLREGMKAHIEKLKEDVVTTNWKGVQLGSDYVIGCKIKQK